MYALSQDVEAPAEHLKSGEIMNPYTSEGGATEEHWLRVMHSRVPVPDAMAQIFYLGFHFHFPLRCDRKVFHDRSPFPEGPALCPPEENLAYRAAEGFFREISKPRVSRVSVAIAQAVRNPNNGAASSVIRGFSTIEK